MPGPEGRERDGTGSRERHGASPAFVPPRAARWRSEAREVFALGPAPWRWEVGVQAGLALGIPLAIFTLAGKQSLGLVASLGAFTALYHASLHRADRLRVLLPIAAGFTLASLIGALAAPSQVATILALIAVATVACIVSFSTVIGPPGPMMFTLVTGVSASLATGRFAGPWQERLAVPGLVAVGAMGAFLITISPLVLPSVRRREGQTGTLGRLLRFEPLDTVSWIVAGRVVIAVTIAAVVAYPAGLGHAYWVVMVAGVVLQGSHSLRHTAVRMAQRVIGTFGGLAVFGLVALARPGGMWLVVLLALLQEVVEIVVARNYGLALLFITPLALSIGTAGNPAIRAVVDDRVVDTLLGVAIATIVLAVSEWALRRFHVLPERAPAP